MAQLAVQIVVNNADAATIFGLVDPMSSLDFEIWQNGTSVMIDVFRSFGLMETELWEIENMLTEEGYKYDYIEA